VQVALGPVSFARGHSPNLVSQCSRCARPDHLIGIPTMATSKTSDGSPSTSSRTSGRPSSAFIGVLAGPILAVLFSFTRMGPPGFVWWEGKGGETIATPLGRMILSILFVSGGFAGGLCGWALDTWYRPRIATAKRQSGAGQSRLWDREIDG
jgi:hypothetical protein